MTRKCDECEYVGLNEARLNHHIWMEHTQVCDTCKRSFRETKIFESQK